MWGRGKDGREGNLLGVKGESRITSLIHEWVTTVYRVVNVWS